MSSSHLAAIEMVALCVKMIVLLWNATLLSGSFQLVDPILYVHRLLLQRKGVVRAFLGLVVVQIRRLDSIRQEPILHRRDDVGQVLELAVEGPLAGYLEVIDIGEGNVRRRTGIERR